MQTSGEWSSASKCTSSASSELASLRLTDVGVDGPPDVSMDSEQQTGKFVCPRCEREFAHADKSRWELHCKRCTDE